MRIAGVLHESIVDGPGVRFVVFAQGCPHHCAGCHNRETWDPSGGEEWSVRDLFRVIRKAPGYVRGITLSGGEPFLQAAQMADLAALAHRQKEWDVVTYTGYVYEDLQDMAEKDVEVARLLQLTDILVDGPYVEQIRDIGLRFRGSANQKIIDMKATREEGRIILLELEQE
ncbi:MAG: anaerobic ribonucleoside-triphosphate reductase activating protein [Peptococcaceae bacterium]|nr:anaerobic ribonucleoside-triphosphate reductase activating protein [Peptococcaceae bacterium]